MSRDNVTVGSGLVLNISREHFILFFWTSSTSYAGLFQQVRNPFFIEVLAENIRVCQGSKGSLRLTNGSVPSPPFDLVIARMEKQSYRDTEDSIKTICCSLLFKAYLC